MLAHFLVAPRTNEWLKDTGRAVQRLGSCGWKFAIQGSLLYIPHSQHPPDNVKLLWKQISNDEVLNHRTKEEEKKKKKRIWQLTHYLCRYPWVTSTPTSTPFLFPTLSICQRRYKIPLSWRLSGDYPSVPQEVGQCAEMLHYRCSKGYSTFNGPQVVHKEEGQKKQSHL